MSTHHEKGYAEEVGYMINEVLNIGLVNEMVVHAELSWQLRRTKLSTWLTNIGIDDFLDACQWQATEHQKWPFD